MNHLLRRFSMRRPLRSFRPRLEHLEDRTVPAVTFAVSGGALTFTGSNNIDTLNLNDDGAGNISFTGSGINTAVTVGGISQIEINLKDGGDFVGYNLNGARTNFLKVNANLKGGRDRVLAKFNNFDQNAGFNFTVSGGADADQVDLQNIGTIRSLFQASFDAGADNDKMNVSFNGDIIGAFSAALLEFKGGGENAPQGNNGNKLTVHASNDVDLANGGELSIVSSKADVTFDYQGAMDVGSNLLLNCTGTGDKEVMKVDITIDADSTGGNVGTSGSAATLDGKGDDDNLRLVVHNNSSPATPVGVFALIDGGLGKDKCTRTANVTGKSCNTDVVVP
jgi:hypothetical protein